MGNVLIAISAILVLISPMVYIHSIFQGKTRPHRTTRFVLMVITILSVWSLSTDKSAAFWLALASAVQSAAVFVLSIKRGMGGWARLDIICLLIALVGIGIWQSTGYPVIGLYASILADFIGYIPAFIKTYMLPDTEDWRFFAIDTVASVFTFMALETFTPYSLGYPVYIFLANIGMVILIFSRKHHFMMQKSRTRTMKGVY